MTVLERCVAVCLDCSELLARAPVPAAEPYAVQSFESYAAMDAWVMTHFPGHQVRSVPGHPSPADAYAEALREDA